MLLDSKSLTGRFFGWIIAQERRRQALVAVERMDDHLLRDIGVTRDELRDAVMADTPKPRKIGAAVRVAGAV